jgi:hypothetical protein
MAAGLMGCATVAPPVDNVTPVVRNVSKGLAEQSRLLMCSFGSPKPCTAMPSQQDRDVVRAHVRDNATLTCEVATKDNKDTAATTPACKCAESKSSEEFETTCASWAGVQ